MDDLKRYEELVKRDWRTGKTAQAADRSKSKTWTADDTRTHKIFKALDEVCYAFDLGKPIWLDANVEEFKRHAKTRFTQDCFIEHVDFDFLEMHVIEED